MDVSGSGSVSLANNDDAKLPSKATYNQYRTVLLDQTDTNYLQYLTLLVLGRQIYQISMLSTWRSKIQRINRCSETGH